MIEASQGGSRPVACECGRYGVTFSMIEGLTVTSRNNPAAEEPMPDRSDMTTTANAPMTTIEPIDIRATDADGRELYVKRDGDLLIGDHAGKFLSPAEAGRIVIALGHDGDAIDEVLWDGGQRSGIDVLSDAIAALQTARDALERVSKA
ncbi:hypothetical protein [Nocardioides sp. YIM 152588]|uniref:hypothetical protein n=1 Tax=Nocardioides sp. YIM 152588 TaxID=3158259 RepID=UPI0032E419BD